MSAHGLSVTDSQAAQLAQYCRLLWDWNSRLNLTRHTNWELFVTRDLLDTIRLAEHVPHGVKVLDVGSGGGVPGVVLALISLAMQRGSDRRDSELNVESASLETEPVTDDVRV